MGTAKETTATAASSSLAVDVSDLAIGTVACDLTEVATEAQLRERNGRLLVQALGRHLVCAPNTRCLCFALALTRSLRSSQALVAHQDEVHAIDATCYHMGGPLLHADIEDYGGSFGACVVCPWHRYPISLRTGECLYRDMSGSACSKGLKQRVHEVVRRDGRILVRLATAPDKVASDTYAFRTPPPSGGTGSMPPPRRSGEVLRAGAAGTRAPPLAPGRAAGDVLKSMSGADGRAPWARSSTAAVPAAAGFRLRPSRPAGGGASRPAAGGADGSTHSPGNGS